MADEMEDLDDERAIELSTIAAIYPELVVNSADPFSASIDIPVEPIKPLRIDFANLVEGAVLENIIETDIHHLSHLPSLTLRICLPVGYPTRKPPVFDVHTQPAWLPDAKLGELSTVGHTIWEEMGRDQVVYSYIDYLRDAAEKGFSLVQNSREKLYLPQESKAAFLDFDLKAKRAKFERETFECGVCLEPKKGAICHRLHMCSHVFCVECLQDFYNNCITEGDVINVKCIAPRCGADSDRNDTGPATFPPRKKRRRAADRTLEPSELLQIPLSQETVQRYIKLKRKKMLESDRNTIYCPRQWCQGPARSEQTQPKEDSDSEDDAPEAQAYDPNTNQDKLPPPHERLAICEDCTFAFCKVCKASWHGEFFSCFPRKQFELTAEERASEDYMRFHTTPCPTCDAHAQKTMGCNHMICFKCNTHFCYLCSAWLDSEDPYQHFNTEDRPCYMRLWELEAGDGGDVGQGYAGGEGEIPDNASDDDDDDEDSESEDEPIPPPAPAPPARIPNHPRRAAAEAVRGRQAGAAVQQAQAARGPRVNARVQAGLARPPPLLGPMVAERGPPVQGLQRFLELVRNDEEDEWDSDEMDDGDGPGGHINGEWDVFDT